VTTPKDDRHLSPELMQAFLDGQASQVEEGHVREHSSSCARCRSELEAWQVLFEDLGELDEMTPSRGFQARVMEGVALLPAEHDATVAARLRGWLGLRSRAPAGQHVAADRVQDLLEGLLRRDEALAVEGHLHTCSACRVEVETWRTFLGSLGGLPSFAPSAAFSERVMAHVRVQVAVVAARPTLKERLQLLARSVSPRTKKRLAALAGAGVTPAVTLALVAYAVFSHPLVTLGNLATFLWLETSDLLGGAVGGLLTRVTESTALFRAYAAMDFLSGSPASLALAVTALVALTSAATWVLYRNVLATSSVDGTYAR